MKLSSVLHTSFKKYNLAKLSQILILQLIILYLIPFSAFATSWQEIKKQGKGQTVYWNAWGGSEEINAYINWVGSRVKEEYGVTLKHVKLASTADAVSRVLAEKAAGRTNNGSVDLIWINGENFAKMKENGLLFGPFTKQLPNFKLVDFAGKPTTLLDFHIAVDGYEAPWGMAKFNFVYNSARVTATPDSIPQLLKWAKSNSGRFSYPHVSDFLGSTFLMQALMELADNPQDLGEAVKSDAHFSKVSAPLWSFLEQLHPYLWRKGKSFPASSSVQKQMLNDSELDIALSFNPSATSAAIANGTLPESARTFVLKKGTIGNTHFVAIPFNSGSSQAAMLVADFLMSPEAQMKKQNPKIWGDSTVLSVAKLSAADQQKFKNLPLGVATLQPEKLGPTLPNPHPDWKNRLDAEWERRYGQ
ncbi:MAG: ABC transporter substrate-binding protein [SAR324 cluster bacterium]|nr:ABC transporter substrate-binding protein [SAR324 cluster bacterium]